MHSLRPELANVQIPDNDGTTHPTNGTKITMRMVLTHTAGFTYVLHPDCATISDLAQALIYRSSKARVHGQTCRPQCHGGLRDKGGFIAANSGI